MTQWLPSRASGSGAAVVAGCSYDSGSATNLAGFDKTDTPVPVDMALEVNSENDVCVRIGSTATSAFASCRGLGTEERDSCQPAKEKRNN